MSSRPLIDPTHLAADIPRSAITATSTKLPEVPGYEVTGEIARGGMGRVLSARDLSLDREVAVKVLLPELSVDEAGRRFVRESKITSRLQHPGIPPIHQLGTLADGSPFLAMKLIRGRTLAQILTARRDPADNLPALVQVFEQICQAVGFAHSQGIIHRDLKPQNVMVGAFGEVQVMDWGLAKDLGVGGEPVEKVESENGQAITRGFRRPPRAGTSTPGALDETQPGSVLGTIPYSPPEQASGELHRLSPWSDVFSLGGILCHILTGKPPYHGFPLHTLLLLAEVCDTADALARLDACGADPELIALCKRSLVKDPENRPADARVLSELVAAYRAGVEERLRTAERDRAVAEAQAAEQKRKRRVQLALVGTLGLLVISAGGFALYEQWSVARQIQLKAERDQEEMDKRASVMRRRERVPGLLALATEQRTRYRLKDAATTLAEARQLAGGGLTDDLIPVVAQAEAELQFLVQLDDIRMKRSVLIAQTGGKGKFDTISAPPAYRKAFLAHGFDIESGDVAEVAARVAASPIKAELVAALDDWAVFEPAPALQIRVLDVASRADPGAWTNRFRDAIVRENPIRLWWLAQQADPKSLRPGTVAALAELMEQRGLDPSRVLKASQYAYPTDFLIAFGLGQWYANRDVQEAITYYLAARSIRPENITVWNNLGGIRLRDRGDRDGAIAEFREAIRLDPQHAKAHYNLGIALNDISDLDGAVTEFREAIKIDPEFANAHNNLGIALQDQNDLDGAIGEFQEAIRIDPQHAQAHNNLGIALKEKGDLDEAIAEFHEAIRIDPELAKAHYNLGLVLKDKGDWNGSIAAFRKATMLEPTDAKARNNLATSLEESGDLDGAIAEYREAIRFDPMHGKACYGLGLVLYKKGDLDGAITAFRAARRIDPTDAKVHHSLGLALKDKGDLEGAIAEYREAIRLDPKFANAHNNLGLALQAQDDLDGAIAQFRAAIGIDPKHAQAHNNLGIALKKNGDLDGAIAEFREAIKIDPKLAKAHYNLGIALEAEGEWDDAITEYRVAIQLDPKDAAAHNNLGVALYQKGDLEGTIAEFREALRLAPKLASAKQNLTVVLKLQVRRDAAIKAAFGIAIPSVDSP